MTEHEMRLIIQRFDCTYGDNPLLIHCQINKPCMKHMYEKLKKLNKIAEDELMKSVDHANKQENRADNLEAELEQMKETVFMLRDVLGHMDLTICSAGDLMTKEDMLECDRLIAMRDNALEETKDII